MLRMDRENMSGINSSHWHLQLSFRCPAPKLSMKVYTSLAVFLTTTLAIVTAAHGVIAPGMGIPKCKYSDLRP